MSSLPKWEIKRFHLWWAEQVIEALMCDVDIAGRRSGGSENSGVQPHLGGEEEMGG